MGLNVFIEAFLYLQPQCFRTSSALRALQFSGKWLD